MPRTTFCGLCLSGWPTMAGPEALERAFRDGLSASRSAEALATPDAVTKSVFGVARVRLLARTGLQEAVDPAPMSRGRCV